VSTIDLSTINGVPLASTMCEAVQPHRFRKPWRAVDAVFGNGARFEGVWGRDRSSSVINGRVVEGGISDLRGVFHSEGSRLHVPG